MSDIFKTEEMYRYCANRCDEYSCCSNCPCYQEEQACDIGFVVDLYDIIDLKTIMKLSYYDIPKVFNTYINQETLIGEYDFWHWLFNNQRYKITKKENEL